MNFLSRLDNKAYSFLNILLCLHNNEIPQTVYEHQHNPMANYDENPLAIGSCWGLEVEMFDKNDRKWIRLDDFPNPGYFI